MSWTTTSLGVLDNLTITSPCVLDNHCPSPAQVSLTTTAHHQPTCPWQPLPITSPGVLDNHWPSPTPIYMACNLPSLRNHPLRCPTTKHMARTTTIRKNTTASTILQQAHTSLLTHLYLAHKHCSKILHTHTHAYQLADQGPHTNPVTRCPSLSPFHSPSECGHTHHVSWLFHLNLAATHQHVTVLLPI